MGREAQCTEAAAQEESRAGVGAGCPRRWRGGEGQGTAGAGSCRVCPLSWNPTSSRGNPVRCESSRDEKAAGP